MIGALGPKYSQGVNLLANRAVSRRYIPYPVFCQPSDFL